MGTVIDPLGLAAIGAGVGVLYGAFGAGGSAFATPMLALAGVPALAAVASPLPATIPAALAGAWSYRRGGVVTDRLARRAIAAGFPAAVAGALCSAAVSGTALLLLSGLLLLAIGARLAVVAVPERARLACRDTTVSLAAAAVGFMAGLLANSGGFLLVPVFVLMAGLTMRQAAGTSLLVAAVLSLPTLATHWAMGHIDWRVAAVFASGLLPGTLAGSSVGRVLPPERTQRAFGVVLLLFAAVFVLRLVV